MVALTGSFALDLGADLLIAVSLGLVLLACLFPGWIERIPRVFWRISPPLLLVLIVTDFILQGGDVLAPLFRMVLILSLYRGLQVRSLREDLQLLLLSLFLLILTGVLSQEITFGIQMLVFAPVAMGLLFAVNLGTRETPVPVESGIRVFRGLRRRDLVCRLRERLDYRTLFSGVFLFLCMTVMALLLFILMPRFDIGAALPFPRLQTSTALSGFSDQVGFGDVVEILEDDAIAMRVDVTAANPPSRPYWRMVVLDAYHADGFMVSPRVARENRRIDHHRFEFTHPRGTRLDDSEWTLYLEGGVSSYIPAGEKFRQFQFNNRMTLQLHDLTRVQQATEINASTLSVRFTGMAFDGLVPPGVDDLDLRGARTVYTDTSDPSYLSEVAFPLTTLVVPDGNANRRILSDAVRRSGLRPDMPVNQQVARIVTYLQEDRGYSLESRIPPGEADRLLRWVASGQPGHCELYAGAFVLIARAAGIPARLVTGFVGGDWNGFENYFMVRNRNAHAWCEVLDPWEGWRRVDPTPGYGLDGGSVEEALAGGRLSMDRTFAAYVDSLRILWFRRVIQFDGEDQLEMAGWVKGTGLTGFQWLRERARGWRDRLDADWRDFSLGGNWTGLFRNAMLPAGVLAAGLLFLLVSGRRRRRRSFEERMRRRAGRLVMELTALEVPDDSVSMQVAQRIRYGPVSLWPPHPLRALHEARRRRSSDTA